MSTFSDFIRSAPGPERDAVFEQVLDAATKRQNISLAKTLTDERQIGRHTTTARKREMTMSDTPEDPKTSYVESNSKPHNPVMHPTHYTHGGIECIDAIQAALTPEEFCGFCKGNVMKYLWRSQHKGAKIQDEKKAQWYLNRMVENGRSVEDD